MYELSNLKQDRQAQEIYRYFKESFIYLENPPARINTKTLPKLPKLTELPIEIQEGPLSLLPTRLTSLMSAGVLQILHDNLIALIPETFISFCHEELITLLHREKDYKSFLSHHFNQKLLALFVGLDSNTHSITLHHFATIHDDFFALSKLLPRKPDINSMTDRHGNTLVHFVCGLSSDDKHSTTFDLLLNVMPCKGVKKQQIKEILEERVNALNLSGESPLHIACKASNITAVKKLLRKGSDCTTTDAEGYLPIHRALEKKYTPIVDLLSERSDPEQLIEGKSILAIAYENDDTQLVNYLINKGICINTAYEGTTILHKLCKNNEVQLVKKLLNAGAQQELIDAIDSEGYTPFRIACSQNNYTIMKSLLKNGANIDFKIGGGTALHEACSSWNYALARFLRDNGANLEELDSAGNKCRMLAQQANHREIYKQLLNRDDDLETSPSSSTTEDTEVTSIGSSISDIADID